MKYLSCRCLNDIKKNEPYQGVGRENDNQTDCRPDQRETNQNWSKGCQAQQIYHVSDGGGCGIKEAVCPDTGKD